MATASKSQSGGSSPVRRLALASFLGAGYVLLGLGLLFGQLPLWWDLLGIANEFLSTTLLLMVSGVFLVAWGYLGRRLEGQHPLPGLRAGVVVAASALFLILLLSLGLGNSRAAVGEVTLGTILTGVVAALLLAGLVFLFLRPGFARWLVWLEEQGWFHARPFKPNLGLRVRRGTFLGLLILIGAGIYTLIQHGTLGTGDWVVNLPWAYGEQALYLLFHVNYLVPLLLLAVLGWLSWRLVNWPVFAEFLIATDAELNKVSWINRRRLIQDTVVVLVTVFLLAVFLFVVDIVWIRILSVDPWIKVLQIDPREERAKQQRPTEW
jgi:preprotein translocase SecE subunit